MSEWQAVGIFEEGVARIRFKPAAKAEFKAHIIAHGPVRLQVSTDDRVSQKARGWYEGGLVRLISHYQEGLDHHKDADRRKVREWLKQEFNSEIVSVAGKAQRVAMSTDSRAVFEPFVQRVQDWFVENYNPPLEAMDPEKWKHWDQTVRMLPDTPDNFLDYLIEIGILKAN